MEPVHLGRGLHDENWLQKLVQDCPEVLPVHQIEPGLDRLISVAREVPVSQGIIDNLFLTPSGDIVIAELKLWRNPEARRTVVAQCLDYVASLVSLSYEGFEAACLQGVLQEGVQYSSLYGTVADDPEVLDEVEFIDAVARNLKLGRILVLAVGDGIRSEVETLTKLLQAHAVTQFVFALIELSIFKEPNGDLLIVPSTIAKTQIIERHVFVSVTQEDFGTLPKVDETGKSKSLTEQRFYEIMATRSPDLPRAIKSLLERLEPLGVFPAWLASLNLKREDPAGGNPINLGYIQKNGQFYTSTAGWFGRHDAATDYHATIANLLGGEVKLARGEWHDNYATSDGKSAPRIEDLLPAHQDAVFMAMKEYLARVLADNDSS